MASVCLLKPHEQARGFRRLDSTREPGIFGFAFGPPLQVHNFPRAVSVGRRLLYHVPFGAQALFMALGWRWGGSALTTALVVLVLPGLGWSQTFAASGWAAALALSLAISYAAVALGVLAHYAVGVLPSPWSLLGWLWLVAVVGQLLALKRGNPLPRLAPVGVVATLAVFSYFYAGATRVVPPQQDQDLVVANPVYGYFKDLKPYGLETHFTFLFSKPSYLHLVAGSSICLWGDLAATRPYYDRARLTEDKNWPRWRIDELRAEDAREFATDSRLLWSTRVTAVALASLVPVVLCGVCMQLGLRTPWAILCGALYTSFPEVFIRSSFAGFTAVGNLFASLVLLLYVGRARGERWGAALFSAAALMAGSNQKALLIVPAVLLHHLITEIRAGGFKGVWSWVAGLVTNPFFLGVVVGWGGFCAYGLWADADTFVRDHLYYDFRDRFLLQDVRFGHLDEWWYPSIPEVWLEFARNLSWLFLPLAAVAVLWLTPRVSAPEWVLVPWMLVGSALGSLTDWRQTKHLMLILPPLIIGWTVVAGRGGRVLRALALAAALFCIVWGLTVSARLWGDFASLPPSTIW